jgi:hypothetical protein
MQANDHEHGYRDGNRESDVEKIVTRHFRIALYLTVVLFNSEIVGALGQ